MVWASTLPRRGETCCCMPRNLGRSPASGTGPGGQLGSPPLHFLAQAGQAGLDMDPTTERLGERRGLASEAKRLGNKGKVRAWVPNRILKQTIWVWLFLSQGWVWNLVYSR